MAEYIHFSITFGDTTDAKKRGKEIAEFHQFSDWCCRRIKPTVNDDGTAATLWRVEGWRNE